MALRYRVTPMTVSYVLTVYNKAAYLPAVLAAVAAERQSTGGEIVIVDDGSTDGSSEILDGFARGGVDITVLHQGNKGVVSATNAGLRTARLPYIRPILPPRGPSTAGECSPAR